MSTLSQKPDPCIKSTSSALRSAGKGARSSGRSLTPLNVLLNVVGSDQTLKSSPASPTSSCDQISRGEDKFMLIYL